MTNLEEEIGRLKQEIERIKQVRDKSNARLRKLQTKLNAKTRQHEEEAYKQEGKIVNQLIAMGLMSRDYWNMQKAKVSLEKTVNSQEIAEDDVVHDEAVVLTELLEPEYV